MKKKITIEVHGTKIRFGINNLIKGIRGKNIKLIKITEQ